MRRFLLIILILFIVNLPVSSASTEILVIVHPENETESLTRRQLIDLYMGRNVNFPNGQPAFPLDQASDSQIRADFYKSLVDKGTPHHLVDILVVEFHRKHILGESTNEI